VIIDCHCHTGTGDGLTDPLGNPRGAGGDRLDGAVRRISLKDNKIRGDKTMADYILKYLPYSDTVNFTTSVVDRFNRLGRRLIQQEVRRRAESTANIIEKRYSYAFL